MNGGDDTTKKWTRYPLVWMLIAIPFSAVIMGVVMITLAIETDSGLVVDDYYEQGKHINRILARDRTASHLGLAALLELHQESGSIIIEFDHPAQTLVDDRIELNLIHATRPGFDKHLLLKNVDPRTLEAALPELNKGRWNLAVQTTKWRLTGSLQVPGPSSVRLLSSYAGE